MIISLFFVLFCNGYTLREGVTPTQKVIQLLQDMAAKGQSEKEEEQKKFSAFKQFCDDKSMQKTRNIKEANEKIDQLKADIQKAESDVAVLAKDIAELDSDIAGWNEDKKAATEEREMEHEDYRTTHLDYSESVDALERAIVVLKRQSHDRAQVSSLLQKVASLVRVPDGSKRVINSFLQHDVTFEDLEDPFAVSAPEANAYEFQSGGIVDMLQKLKDKFSDERATLEKEEMKGKHAFEMFVQDLTDSIEGANSERSNKLKAKTGRQEDAANAKADLADTTASRDADQKYLDELVAECEQKSTDFESRQQLRQEELEAIQKAVTILAGGAVSGAAAKHLPGMMQTSLSQFMAIEMSPLQKNVAEFLQDRADKYNSRILAQIAQKVAADPFAKVRKMIKDLLVRLMEEANEEAEHKGWCDTELATNKQTRDEKQDAVEMLAAKADKLEADIGQLSMEIASLADAIAAIDKAVAEATDLRGKEKATNEETIKDAKAAQEAVSQALIVLKEFYDKAAQATAFVQSKSKQSPQDEAPETFSEPYTGMQSENGGVVGMIEVIASDFARLESETTAAEEQAQKEFERFSASSAKDKAVKSTDTSHKVGAKMLKEGELGDTKKDLKGTQAELDAALAYYERLKPSCVDAGVNYEDRVQRRKEEIESLQEALKILSGEAI